MRGQWAHCGSQHDKVSLTKILNPKLSLVQPSVCVTDEMPKISTLCLNKCIFQDEGNNTLRCLYNCCHFLMLCSLLLVWWQTIHDTLQGLPLWSWLFLLLLLGACQCVTLIWLAFVFLSVFLTSFRSCGELKRTLKQRWRAAGLWSPAIPWFC